MAAASAAVPDLLIVLDSSRSMEGPKIGTKTHRATLAAIKACWFAHRRGAEIAAINFSEKYLALPWTRDLNAVKDVLVEFLSMRTHIPGKTIRLKGPARQAISCSFASIRPTGISTVNYHALKDVACDYVKSRVASGGLTKPP
ncbi:MAG: VWA domain-containing protein [Methanothrix sp.]|jgi:hypothetical protein|nr:VWA domain-containing protein [Methanothrix sp.]